MFKARKPLRGGGGKRGGFSAQKKVYGRGLKTEKKPNATHMRNRAIPGRKGKMRGNQQGRGTVERLVGKTWRGDVRKRGQRVKGLLEEQWHENPTSQVIFTFGDFTRVQGKARVHEWGMQMGGGGSPKGKKAYAVRGGLVVWTRQKYKKKKTGVTNA